MTESSPSDHPISGFSLAILFIRRRDMRHDGISHGDWPLFSSLRLILGHFQFIVNA